MGVVPAHELPVPPDHFPAAFVANTHTKEKPGEHWVVFYWFKDGSMFLFDSFARTPEEMGHPDWRDYLNAASNMWNRQECVMQDESTSVCGLLCALYIAFTARGTHFGEDWLKMLKPMDLWRIWRTLLR